MRRTLIIGVIVTSMLIIAALVIYYRTADDRAYEVARKTDTIEAYKIFTRKFPKSAHISGANARMAELAWETERSAWQPENYERFLLEYPDSKYTSAAKGWLEDFRQIEKAAKKFFAKGGGIYLDGGSAPDSILAHCEDMFLRYVRSPSSKVHSVFPTLTYPVVGGEKLSSTYYKWEITVPMTRTGFIRVVNPEPGFGRAAQNIIVGPGRTVNLQKGGVMTIVLNDSKSGQPISNEIHVQYKSAY